jgi:branched-chain amino acid transport system permease protein
MRLFSHDRPGHWLLTALLLALLLVLASAPFVLPGTKALAVAARILIFIVLAASYDLLLGYTGIVSFAQISFFGLGAYGVAIALTGGGGWLALILGAAAGIAVSVLLALAMALLSLRVRAIFFSMITLALARFVQVLASEWRDLTGGEDGLTFSVPRLIAPGFHPFAAPILGLRVSGTVIAYYLLFALAAASFLILLRIVNSPFGRVLQAIRENPFRAEALGYRTILHRALASALAAGFAALAGVMMAMQLRYTNPDTTLSFSLMIDILLMVVIGGMGTLYGAALGATVMVLAQYYLQPLLAALATAARGVPLLPALLDPERWLLWLGLIFVLVVYFFPAGIVGSLRIRTRRAAAAPSA